MNLNIPSLPASLALGLLTIICVQIVVLVLNVKSGIAKFLITIIIGTCLSYFLIQFESNGKIDMNALLQHLFETAIFIVGVATTVYENFIKKWWKNSGYEASIQKMLGR